VEKVTIRNMRRVLLWLLLILALIFLYFRLTAPAPDRQVLWGATFSARFSRDLGLDWKANYAALLDDLKIRHLRIPIYWDIAEPKKDSFDFSETDYEVAEAAKRGADVILTIGVRSPRWPECYYPGWTANLDDTARQERILKYVRTAAARYATSSAVRYIQVENEPYLRFGNCPYQDVPGTLEAEIKAAREAAPLKPILLTSSIFVDPWYHAAKRADIFGTSMYTDLYNDQLGYVHYPFPPEYFRVKSAIIRALLNDFRKPFIVIELQAEPWVKGGLSEGTLAEQKEHYSPQNLANMLVYAKKSGFGEYYLWGSEWWYFMSTKQNDPAYWEVARGAFKTSK
jgi:hypothetical protein